ncbi:MAG: hypothetical protein WC592_07915 [Candidatus Omnitrophota bacterium]|nr:hypothetical protein [Candidatus Omnitrophota bacterium]
MKYKTTIEIISDASDKCEAADIAGEYLSGNLVSGVAMKCRTSAVCSYKKTVVAIFVVVLVVSIGIFSAWQPRISQSMTPLTLSGISAVQPPLKTAQDKKSEDFKKEWQKKQNKAAIDLIKSVR